MKKKRLPRKLETVFDDPFAAQGTPASIEQYKQADRDRRNSPTRQPFNLQDEIALNASAKRKKRK